MATIVNQQPSNTGNNGMGFLLGVIIVIAVVVLFLFYGLPYFRGAGTQVNLPSNVNVHTSK